MMKIFKSVVTLLALSALVACLSACPKKEGPAEKAGKEIDRAAEKTGDKIEKAGDKINDAVKDLKK